MRTRRVPLHHSIDQLKIITKPSYCESKLYFRDLIILLFSTSHITRKLFHNIKYLNLFVFLESTFLVEVILKRSVSMTL